MGRPQHSSIVISSFVINSEENAEDQLTGVHYQNFSILFWLYYFDGQQNDFYFFFTKSMLPRTRFAAFEVNTKLLGYDRGSPIDVQ